MQTTKANPQETQSSQGQSSGQGPLERRRQGNFPMTTGLTPGEFLRMGPFSMMKRFTEEMDRFFNETIRGEERERTWVPAIDVSQGEGNYVVRAELAGLKPEEVKVEVTDAAVVLQGERKFEQDETKSGMHMTERRYGRFYRAIPLPEGAKTDEAKARFENGVLEVTVPVEEQKIRRREVPIQQSSPGGGTKAA